jgi:O-acetyl-ADP-ribose deacetylase (regulator of RNase III)
MVGSSDDVGGTLNVAWSFAAALQAAHAQNRRASDESGMIRSIAVPGLGARTGRVPPDACAAQMWTAYQLLREQQFDDFASMRAALLAHLGDPGGARRKVARKRMFGIFPVREKSVFRFA